MTTLVEICEAIETTLGAAVTHSQQFDELTEAITDLPMLQVYPQSLAMDAGMRLDRKTFQGGARQESYLIHADLFAIHRGPGIGEEMGVLLPLVDAMVTIFKAQDKKPYFGLEAIEAFGPVTGDRVVFDYGGDRFVGMRFTIPVRVF